MKIDLDHVALAARDCSPALALLAGELGGTPIFGGQAMGFRPMQVRVGDAAEGMTVELLEPWNVEHNDFLERFIVRHGAGPHHLTFKVDDLDEVLERIQRAGVHPVNVDRRDPAWQEAFLLPREAHGTVVQLAQARDDFPDRARLLDYVARYGADGHPKWWTDPPRTSDRNGYLRRVVIGTPALEEAIGFFSGIMTGEEFDQGDGWVELVWPDGARLRLEYRASVPGGVDRLEGDLDGESLDVTVCGTRLVFAAR